MTMNAKEYIISKGYKPLCNDLTGISYTGNNSWLARIMINNKARTKTIRFGKKGAMRSLLVAIEWRENIKIEHENNNS